HDDKIDLLTTVLHEFGHGLGFLSLVSPAQSGTFPQNQPDIWSYFMYDEDSGKHWVEMASDADRAASAISAGLAWDGPSIKAAVPSVLLSPLAVRVTAAPTTPAVVKDYDYVMSSLSVAVKTQQYVGDLAVASTRWACTALGPIAPMTGKI